MVTSKGKESSAIEYVRCMENVQRKKLSAKIADSFLFRLDRDAEKHQQLAVVSHNLDQVYFESHSKMPPDEGLVIAGCRMVDSPLETGIWFAGLRSDAVQHFAILSHSLNQVLHHVILHNITSKFLDIKKGMRRSGADFIQHFPVGGHGLDQVLHHSILHNIYLQM